MKMVTRIRRGLPFVCADWLDGVAFGAVAAGVGLGVAAPTVLSATAFSGTAQFAALTVLGQHGGLVSVLVAVAALNARYVVYGLSVAPALSPNRLKRSIQAQLLTDVSWALSQEDGRADARVLAGVGLLELLAWTTGTAAGALAGNLVGNVDALGIDALIPAFFGCVLLERIGGGRDIAFAVAAGGAAVLLTPFVPAGLPLALVLVAALARRPRR
jgi:predicted branched-subunit amino acid permease